MLNVVCVKLGKKYGPEYPNILFDMVRRNLKNGLEGKFWCVTDDPSGLDPEIAILTPPDGLTGWWGKLWLFSPGLFPEGERILYFDLDVIITGGLDELASYSGDFAILEEFNGHPGWQSSLMAWRSGYGHEVWEKWLEQDRPEVCGGDQEWIEIILGKADLLQSLYPGAFLSYKIQCRIGEPPRGAKVIIFHGEPKPDNCAEEWARMIWKIGGGSAADLDLVCNTADEILTKNIRSACKRNVPWIAQCLPHDGHAVIVGGAPSVKKFLEEIRFRKGVGQKIFALNNAFAFLRENGIEPDTQVMVDARSENAEFVPEESSATHYFASQCHPDVWDKAEKLNTVLWHSYTDIIDDGLENPERKPELLIAGGTTVGLSTMALCHGLGYRKIHIYGMDSSYSDENHHAYSQSLNDRDVVLDVVCHDRKFKSTAWMVAQANQFQTLAITLAEMNVLLTIHGDGLIPWIAKHLEMSARPDTEIVKDDDGVFWPSRDKLGRTYIVPSLRDARRLIARCENHRVAIQAGGNVGLWAKELAKHFETVITFEPDKLNFSCLELNCLEQNIEKHNAALGNILCRKGLYRDPSNCGAHAVVDGDEFNVVTIDSLELEQCDLIQLDVEGYELYALQGAEKTIKKHHPVICIEIKSLGMQFGISDGEVVSWLESFGYEQVQKMGRDVVFAKSNIEDQCNNKYQECTTA